MAKSKTSKKSSGSHHHKTNPRAKAKSNHHARRRRMNELLPVPLKRAGTLIVAAGAGGIIDSYGTNLILGANDAGLLGITVNVLGAVVPAWLLKKWPDIALGWLLGGGTMVLGRLFDILFGKQVITYQWPAAAGISSYYAPASFPLPYPPSTTLFGSPPAAASRRREWARRRRTPRSCSSARIP